MKFVTEQDRLVKATSQVGNATENDTAVSGYPQAIREIQKQQEEQKKRQVTIFGKNYPLEIVLQASNLLLQLLTLIILIVCTVKVAKA